MDRGSGLINFPIYSTRFFERETTAADIVAILVDPAVRLLTLVGASGTGKTRLSIQVAELMRDHYPDGCYFIPLAPVSRPELVLSSFAKVIDVQETAGESLMDSLVTWLSGKRAFFVVDNVEQIKVAAQEFQTLLERTEGVKILVTSQVPLDLGIETLYAVPPFSIPPESATLTVEELLSYSSIGLFVDRKRVVDPTFALSEENASAVIDICTAVQGLPLAIELIAAHSSSIQPGDLLRLLRNYLAIGRMLSRDNSRHHILHPVLDWCYSRLTNDMQALFARMSVFVGGFTPVSAHNVCNANLDITQDIESSVQTFQQKNILLEEALFGDMARYIMIDAVHEYAGTQLRRRKEQISIRNAHATYYLALTETAAAGLKSADQGLWTTRLESEHHNIRTALSWLFAQQQYETALHLSCNLVTFWFLRGYLSEGRRWLKQGLGHIMNILHHNPDLVARVHRGLGTLAYGQGDFTEAQEHYTRSLDIYRATHNAEGTAPLLTNLGLLALKQGQLDQAQILLEDALQVWQTLEKPWEIANVMNTLAIVATEQRDMLRAMSLYTQSMDRWRSVSYTPGVAIILNNLGEAEFYAGEYVTAQNHLEEALVLWRELGNVGQIPLTLYTLGLIVLARNDDVRADALFREGLASMASMGDQTGIATGLEAIAAVYTYRRQWQMAVQALAVAAHLRDTIQAPLPHVDHGRYHEVLATLHRHVSNDDFDRIWNEAATSDVAQYLQEHGLIESPRG